VLLLPAVALAGPTYYVDGVSGDDLRTAAQASDPATPWKTIKKAVSAGGLIGMTNKGVVLDGYTVVVQPGLYLESVESKRDGLATAPVTIKAATPGTVTIRPPAGTNGFFVSHHYHVIDGFVVTGASVGIKLGPHDGGDGPVTGLVARNNQVSGNSNNGIQFANAQNGEAAFNTVFQNGATGINYSGNASAIHDNLAYNNAQFGIYVRDGINHQVWNNTAYGNPSGDIKIAGSQIAPPGGRTFYVGLTGNDTNSDVQAQNPQTPWKTFSRALAGTNPGDTLLILPGLYTAKLESVRDGLADAPISIRAADPGTVTIQPPSGSAVYIGHHYHTIEGLVVTGAGTALQMGPYKQTSGAVNGLVARHNEVTGNGAGIKFTNAVTATAAHNVVWNNAKDGIAYTWASQTSCPAGSGATIFNNLVYANGGNLSGEYGITVGCGDGNKVINNTVYANQNGGIRLGVAGDVPVTGTVVNNIVVGSPIGIKEPAGSNYTGQVTLDFNDVYGNGQNYALGPATKVGPSAISTAPGFVDAAGGDFRLGRVATGQPVDSPCIDKGSDTADGVGLGSLTAFADKYPDAGRVDLGYHGTLLYPSQGTMAIHQAVLTLDPSGAGLVFSANLKPGAGSDGINPGNDFAQVTFGELTLSLWTAGTAQQGSQWIFTGNGVNGVLDKLPDGSVDVAVRATGLSLATLKFPTAIGVRVGDDYASASGLLVGTLQVP
jgi:parallel beta-helix repeat protein